MVGIRALARAQNDGDDPKFFTTAQTPIGTAIQGIKTDTTNGIKGRLYSLHVVSKTATAYWLQVFDSQAAPIANANPKFRIQVPTSAQALAAPTWKSMFGWSFSLGCWVALSTTPDTLTFAAANDAHVTAEYK